jgi:hypothetical protein
MNALEQLEKSSQLDQHLASHDYAERFYVHVERLFREGYQPAQVREAVRELHCRARERGEAVKRDGLVEVLDALDEEYPTARAKASRSG